ncbi:histidine phosphatase family protein [Paenibacillus agaridevorans]|uniref:histidine phosphatase family protein n=1 Tax=Paenibacillus agaridevorans TaxID=171404 RepID=UPI002159CA9D|nr:phosphoglycerate mutase family protein [Paenibacillus agaridevorans]
METIIYFVRHAESPYIAGMERSRGLSENGILHAIEVKNILINQDIDYIISSPYERAIQTVQPLATELNASSLSLRGRSLRSLKAVKVRKYTDVRRN